MAVRVRREGRVVTIDVRADAFLRGMVRRMVAVLIEVGLGKMDEDSGPSGTRRPGTGLRRGGRPGEGALPPARRPRADTGTNERRTRGTMNAKTYSVREGEIERRWYVVDATDETLGRLASRIAHVLEGKHKPTYQPNLDSGDHVIVLNAVAIAVTSDKLESKLYSRHSGYPAGLQAGDPRVTCSSAGPRRSSAAPSRACCRTTASGAQQLRKLKIYAGSDHPHQAQRPEPLA